MDAIDALKQKVLSLAIQGKLVPQDPNDEPASELLKKIKAEKAELVKQGKIKKEKQESYIFRGDDSKYYEKIGDETKDITDEIPFEIPGNWEWVRLSSFCKLDNGEKVSNVKLPLLDAKYLRGKSSENILDTGVLVNKDDYIILVDGENSGEVFKAPVRGIMGTTFKKLYISTKIYNDYVLYLLKYYQDMFRNSKRGAAIPHLDKHLFANLVVGLPPLSEQERIVREIERIFAEIEVVKENQEELARLKDGLKSKILDLAIQGKLVEQDPNDEPASVLLEKIKTEKQELIKQGKIKKDKQESYIYKGSDNRHYEKIGDEVKDITDEIPFEIPNNWEWVRLNTICQINPRNAVNNDVEASFIPMNMIQDGFRNKHTFVVKKWKEIKSGFTHFMNNDIGIAKITPCFENRKSVIFTDLMNGVGSGTTELHILRPYHPILPEYILLLCKTEHFITNGVKNFTGTAGQQRINSQFVKGFLCPLPPLNEQKKVINKVSKMFEIIENL
ncbi:MAG: restriction endonuclease subunit S [Muribaculaceae bacterium]|nr:restriction endonuclease subunit S [Muribaculaceae bacterium]